MRMILWGVWYDFLLEMSDTLFHISLQLAVSSGQAGKSEAHRVFKKIAADG